MQDVRNVCRLSRLSEEIAGPILHTSMKETIQADLWALLKSYPVRLGCTC
jgi:hypothetical protein